MHWFAPAQKDTANDALEKRVWAAADQLRGNSGLKSSQYSQPVLELIFLRFAEVLFGVQRAAMEKQAVGGRRGSRVEDPTAYDLTRNELCYILDRGISKAWNFPAKLSASSKKKRPPNTANTAPAASPSKHGMNSWLNEPNFDKAKEILALLK